MGCVDVVEHGVANEDDGIAPISDARGISKVKRIVPPKSA
jgi:hypothetical protein